MKSAFWIKRAAYRGLVLVLRLFKAVSSLLLSLSLMNSTLAADDYYDLTPYYIKEPRFKEVYFSYLNGELKKARALLKAMLPEKTEFAVPKESLKYFLARMEMKAGMEDEALETLLSLSGFTTLQNIVFSHLAELHLKKGSLEKGYEYLTMVKLGSHGFITARLELARMMLSRNEITLLVPVLRDLLKIELSDDERFETMLLLSKGLIQQGELEESRGLLYRIFIDSNSDKIVKEAAELLEKTGVKIKWIDYELKKSLKNPSKWAQSWTKRLKKEKGKAYPDGFAHYVQGEYYRAARKEPESAIRKYRQCIDEVQSEIKPWCMMAYAETLRRVGDDDGAVEVYLHFLEEFPKHLFSFRALVESVHLSYRLGKEEAADKAISGVQLDSLPINCRRELLWTAGWGNYINGDFEEALRLFDSIINSFNIHRATSMNSMLHKALYWKGKALFRLGDIEASKNHMKELVGKAAFSYYGLLAKSFLDEMIHDLAEEVVTVKKLPAGTYEEKAFLKTLDLRGLKIRRHPYLDSAVELLRLGFKTDALCELQAHFSTLGLSQDGCVLLAYLASKTRRKGFGNFLPLQKFLKVAYSDPSFDQVYKLVYPFPLRDEIEEFSKRFGVSEYLIPPLIQFESGFRKEAVSPAGARGLMQLMPFTANAVLTKLFGRKGVKKSELHQVGLNLSIGIAYLGELFSHFKDSSFLSFLGYNAGPLIAKKLWKRYQGLTGEELLEETEYRSSAIYIKNILSNYSAYSYIYGGDMPSLKLELPETLGPFMKQVSVSEKFN